MIKIEHMEHYLREIALDFAHYDLIYTEIPNQFDMADDSVSDAVESD